ncbi:hypothetical protein ACX5I6_02325 [Arthrobacter sp. MMS24-T111]
MGPSVVVRGFDCKQIGYPLAFAEAFIASSLGPFRPGSRTIEDPPHATERTTGRQENLPASGA